MAALRSGRGRMRLTSLFTAPAPEDEILARIELPRIVERAAKVVVVATAGIDLAGLLVADGPFRLFDVVFLAAAFVPWLLWILGRLAAGPLFAALVLVPPAVLAVLALADHRSVEDSALQYYFNFAIVMWALLTLAPRRQVAAIWVASFVTFLVLFVASDNYIVGLVWMVVFAVLMLSLVGVRAGAIEIARVQKRLARAQAADARRQIARDVHDVVAHTLAVTMLHLTAARMAVARGAADDAAEALDEAERQGVASLADVRRVLQLLQPEAAEPGIADIPALVAGYRSAGLRVRLTREGTTDGVSPTAGLTAYRVVQEALANAARHGTGSAAVDLYITNGTVELTVRNPVDQPAAVASSGNGIGGMRERVQAAGGAITVGPGPVDGEWQVHAVLGRVYGPLALKTGAGTT